MTGEFRRHEYNDIIPLKEVYVGEEIQLQGAVVAHEGGTALVAIGAVDGTVKFWSITNGVGALVVSPISERQHRAIEMLGERVKGRPTSDNPQA